MMDTKKLESWANKLLDTGKRNNLINFKNSKRSSLEVVLPDVEVIYAKTESTFAFEVFQTDPDEEEEEEQLALPVLQDVFDDTNEADKKRENYINKYARKIKKQSQILLYNESTNPITALRSIDKKAKTALEEAGVNVLYMAFGFIQWKESDTSEIVYNAPVLLAPISISNISAVSPFYIHMSEDDVIVNPTFNYLLNSQYGINLPELGDGSLAEYLDAVDGIIAPLKWKTERACKIGIFSFLKLNMYEDLKNNQDKILENENVRTLLGEPPVNCDDSTVGSPDDKEVSVKEEDLHNVIDADSSQLEAIKMAKRGRSFVLQGPPGTGKSQTITNIIAECLSDGKKVLFVSEKQAALNVVYDKLKKVGLSEFCLELHSYKANKKDVIEELCHTLRLPKSNLSSRAESEIEQKQAAQKELDDYERELHRTRDVIDKSLYQLYDAYSACRNAPEIDYVIPDIQNKNEQHVIQMSRLLEEYAEFIPSIGYDYTSNPWYGFNKSDLTYETTVTLQKALDHSCVVFNKLVQMSEQLNQRYGFEIDSYDAAQIINHAFVFLSTSEFITPDLMNGTSIQKLLKTIDHVRGLSIEINHILDEIDALYDKEIYKIDGTMSYKKLARQYTNAVTRQFNSEYKELIAAIRMCRKDNSKINHEEACRITKQLSQVQPLMDEFYSMEDEISAILGPGYIGLQTDWDTCMTHVQYMEQVLSQHISFGRISRLSGPRYQEERANFRKISDYIIQKFGDHQEDISYIDSCFDSSVISIKSGNIRAVLEKLTSCQNSVTRLDNWCAFTRIVDGIERNKLGEFVRLSIEKGISPEQISTVYKKAFYRQWIDYTIHQSGNVLLTFSGIKHDKAVDIFKQKDKLQFDVSIAQIRSDLSRKRPATEMISRGSALAILTREGEKKRKQKSIRNLLSEIGDLAQLLKPCFLMSPLSVSTFLSASNISFDTVIFDEASQIFPQDAIGAIYRGKQLIVVGDSKQMPPTDFFNSSVDSDNDDDETEDINDFESILDICASTMQRIRLQWHYRSRYEQLIDFSNRQFYDGELISFPAVSKDKKWTGVDYYNVDGVYERGNGRNKKEAEFIVDLIYENFARFPRRSLGVVAFNIKQQDLIEKLLFKKRQEDPSYEELFSSEQSEPFFVKNLETVQGDERDTIIFSTTYGRDSAGKLMQNYGPLNREGGERRLNVAVTRAKYNIQLVTSLHYTDINLTDTVRSGKSALRDYLDYAENGTLALDRAITVNAFEEFDSEFEMEVYDYLVSKGYSVDTQVGVSNYRIDLALKRENSSDYFLAIECDGATYHSSRNARDRDRLRQSILEGMGWRFYRIWSTDWFRNPEVTKERLLQGIHDALLEADRAIVEESNPYKTQDEQKSKSEESTFEVEIPAIHREFPKYEMSDDGALMRAYRDPIDVVREIAQKEAPISEEWLLKRIVSKYGKTKVTSVVRRQYALTMSVCQRYGMVRRGGFIYLDKMDKYLFRVPADDCKREIKYVAPEELAVGMLYYIKQNYTVDRAGLYSAIAKDLGFQRVGEAIYDHMAHALSLISGLVDVDGDSISLKQEYRQ